MTKDSNRQAATRRQLNRREFMVQASAAGAALAVSGRGSVLSGLSASAGVSGVGHDEIIRMTVTEGVDALASGQISALEYCNATLAQAEKFRDYNIFSQMSSEYALGLARAIDEKRASGGAAGALGGLPYALKDSVDMVEFYTIAGHREMKTFRPKLDAELVTALKDAGAVCVGKTQIPPLSMWWTTENAMTGDTGNPFNMAYKTGGSSGGSGAAVAARIVPFAIAEDTGGSIRVPAAINGVLGLRPTTGRWPLAGAVPIGFSDTLGPIARSVEDLRFLDSLFATDGPHPPTERVSMGGLRIGYQSKDFMTDAHPWVEDNFEATATMLSKAGVTLVELSGIESQTMYGLTIALLLSEFPDAMARYFDRHEVDDRTALGLLRQLDDGNIKESWLEATANAPTGEARYDLVQQLLGLRAEAAEIIRSSGVDAFMYPTTRIPNTRNDGPKVMEQVGPLGRTLSELEIGTNMFFAPAMKAPSMAMYTGMDPDGLPLSVTFDAASGADRRLLDVAEAIEKVLPGLMVPASVSAM